MTIRKVGAGLIVLLCFAILIALGMWQLQRLQWKQALLASLQRGMDAPPIAWTGAALPEFTHVKLTGGTLHIKPELYLNGRTLDGVGGAHVIALYDLPGGTPVIVDRGFVPLPVDPAMAEAPASGAVDGIVRVGNNKAWFEPVNDAAKNQWYWMDLPAMGKALGAQAVAPLYVEAVKPTGASGPIPTGGRLAANIPNNHLQYAITWFSLACVLAVMYGTWLLRQTDRKK